MNIPELDELYALYRADLYRYLCRLTRDSAAAEDLLSETFLRALKGAVTFRGESGVKTWLFTIARNAWCETPGAKACGGSTPPPAPTNW